MKSVEERFWSRVALPNENGCMLWTGTKSNGYGQIGVNGKVLNAHRLSLIMADGLPIDTKMQAAHSPGICHNRACVAPNHLRWATQSENERDKYIDGTVALGESHKNSKLSEKEVLEIRELYSTKQYTQLSLAKHYNVDQRTISRIVRHEQWIGG